jgi:ATP-binding cassette, subfamily C (CFTR/MRP), member 1
VWTTALTIVSLFVIFAIQWLEHSRLRNANGVVLFYWLFLLISFTVKLRSLVSQQIYDSNLPYFVTYCVGFGLSLVEFLWEWLWPRRVSAYEALIDEEECPVEYATVFSLLTFSWMTPLMKFGYKQFLTEEDLWGLAKKDATRYTGEAFDKAWQYELKSRKNPSIWIALFRAYGGPYSMAAIFKIGNDIAQYLQPQLLRYLISFVDSYGGEKPQPIAKGAAIALAMFGIACFQTAMIVIYPPFLCLFLFQLLTRMVASILPAGFCDGNENKGGLGICHLQEVTEPFK